MRVSSKILLVILLFQIFLYLANPDTIQAQGYLFCRTDSFGTCEIDSNVSPNPDCDEGFVEPKCDPAYTDCCDSKNAQNSCTNVSCEPDPASAPLCNDDEVCTGLDPGTCASAKGRYTACTVRTGGLGTCCQPGEPPTGNSCPASSPLCDRVGGGDPEATCKNNQGIYQSCDDPTGGTGNCCLPGGDVYLCEWTGVKCVENLSSVTSRCGNNYGHCPSGDNSCVSCDELGESNCNSTPLKCVEQNETIGYYCQSSTFGCLPCFDWMDEKDPNNPDYIYYEARCDPPSYRGGNPNQDFANCNLACTGQTPARFRCDSKAGCVEDGSGEFETFQECSIECSGGANKLFCDENGDPVIKPNPNWIRLYTAIGCIPFSFRGSDAGDITPAMKFLLEFAVGLAGGLGLFLIIFGAIQVMMSGDPERSKAGRELITAAVSGIVLLIFGVFILRIIGIDLLGIPGF